MGVEARKSIKEEDEDDEEEEDGDEGVPPSMRGSSSTPMANRTSATVGRRFRRLLSLTLPTEESSEGEETADVAQVDLARLQLASATGRCETWKEGNLAAAKTQPMGVVCYCQFTTWA